LREALDWQTLPLAHLASELALSVASWTSITFSRLLCSQGYTWMGGWDLHVEWAPEGGGACWGAGLQELHGYSTSSSWTSVPDWGCVTGVCVLPMVCPLGMTLNVLAFFQAAQHTSQCFCVWLLELPWPHEHLPQTLFLFTSVDSVVCNQAHWPICLKIHWLGWNTLHNREISVPCQSWYRKSCSYDLMLLNTFPRT
jgi:hypothetical protein